MGPALGDALGDAVGLLLGASVVGPVVGAGVTGAPDTGDPVLADFADLVDFDAAGGMLLADFWALEF